MSSSSINRTGGFLDTTAFTLQNSSLPTPEQHFTNQDEHPTIDLKKIEEVYHSLIPLTLSELDREGNTIKLWKYKNNLIASVQGQNGEIAIIPGRKVHNSLQPQESPDSLITRLERTGLRKWSFAYLKETKDIYLWPLLIAAGQDPLHIPTGEFIELPSQKGHQIRIGEGHFSEDTSENRAIIRDMVTNRDNFQDTDDFKNDCYLKMLPNGTQAWAKVRNGKITEWGVNTKRENFRKFVNGRLVAWKHRYTVLSPPLTVKSGNSGDKGRLAGANVRYHATHSLTKESFKENVQQNRLAESYNAGNSGHPIPEKGGGGSIGGVGNTVGLIEGLFNHWEDVEETEHYFYIPTADGTMPFSNEALQQMLRELAIGIYRYDTVPFFSLHFNESSHMYPVIHPAYQNTSVGRAIGLLDYYMKGFLNGGFFDEAFIKEWLHVKTQEKEVLKSHCIDLHAYCKQHLDIEHSYLSIREILDKLENDHPQLKTAVGESSLFSDYSGFRSSFRIIAKQNSIQKVENLFTLDSAFDVLYTIEPDPLYEEELRRYRYRYGDDPIGYKRLSMAYSMMCDQIKTTMPLLPHFRELFEQLKVINFFSYYFKTLKKAQKVPRLESKTFDNSLACPLLFPHLPIQKVKRTEVELDFGKVYQRLSAQDRKTVLDSLKSLGSEEPHSRHMLLNEGADFMIEIAA